MKNQTIAAISTAVSSAGIGIVRISGEEAFEIADRVYRSPKGKKKLSTQPTHTIHYGAIYDGEEAIDEVLVMLMRAPRSFTAEDTVEINCHGGVYAMKRVLETVIKHGAQPAQPGEFSKRAFLNGRMDLSQAEAVMDLIEAKNEYALKSSLTQLKGSICRKIKALREEILYEIAWIESALDDPEHISLDGYGDRLQAKNETWTAKIRQMLAAADNGKMIKEGVKTVIVGKPNAGKSSLLNVLTGTERAIVTDIAGTTRDVLEEEIHLNGMFLKLVDTAGIRKTEDIVEQIGVERAKKYAEDADLILYVADASAELDKNDEEILRMLENRKAVVLLNKTDLAQVITEEMLKEKIKDHPVVSISAKEETGIERLEKVLKELFWKGEITFNDEVYITNVRHKKALADALESLLQVKESIALCMPEDFYSIDLMSAYETLGTITGEAVEDDLVNEIFSKFCMGK